MLQKLALLKPKGAFMKWDHFPLVLSMALPTLAVTLFALFFLEGSQKSQLVLLSLALLLFGAGLITYFLSSLHAKYQTDARTKAKEETRHFEDTQEHTHRHEIARYREKLKEYESSFIEMQSAYDQKLEGLTDEKERYKREVDELNFQMEKKLDEIRAAYLEFEDVRKEMARIEEELKRTTFEADEKILRKETLLHDYQHTIYEQRRVLEKKQRYIGRLESKVSDLMYEVRTLLQLEQAPSDPNIDLTVQDEKALSDYYLPPVAGVLKSFDMTAQLEHYIAKAESFTGADHLGPRFSGLSQSSYQIDLRRFFDQLQDESSCVLFFYAPQEGRFLFVNNYVTTLLGHSPEKFSYKFSELVEKGLAQWQEACAGLQEKSSTRARLMMRTKEGESVLVVSQMALVGKGPFTGAVIGILAPSEGDDPSLRKADT